MKTTKPRSLAREASHQIIAGGSAVAFVCSSINRGNFVDIVCIPLRKKQFVYFQMCLVANENINH
ncbi:unnamed protein product [Gadus morhua 'NCC']